MNRDLLVLSLACCLERARAMAGGREGPESEVYWHTRESLPPIARSHGIPWQDVLRSHRDHVPHLLREQVEDLSEPVWPDVAHPDVLASEVMES